MAGEIVNRVANSPIVTFKLEELHPQGDRILIDIADLLFQGMILREKDLREWVKTHDWAQYQNKYVAITCSVDALVQVWAYMLIQTKLDEYATFSMMGTLADLEIELYRQALAKVDFSQFEGKPVVVKGCGDIKIPDAIFVEATRLLMPYVKKLSYGEPCSTVPLYRRK